MHDLTQWLCMSSLVNFLAAEFLCKWFKLETSVSFGYRSISTIIEVLFVSSVGVAVCWILVVYCYLHRYMEWCFCKCCYSCHACHLVIRQLLWNNENSKIFAIRMNYHGNWSNISAGHLKLSESNPYICTPTKGEMFKVLTVWHLDGHPSGR